MKKLVLLLLAGLLLTPSELFANRYKKKPLLVDSPVRTPNQFAVGVYLDEITGDLAISPNYDITDMQITIISNGITYLNTTVSLNAGQTYTDCLDFLSEGSYILTLSTSSSMICQYEITVEED